MNVKVIFLQNLSPYVYDPVKEMRIPIIGGNPLFIPRNTQNIEFFINNSWEDTYGLNKSWEEIYNSTKNFYVNKNLPWEYKEWLYINKKISVNDYLMSF